MGYTLTPRLRGFNGRASLEEYRRHFPEACETAVALAEFEKNGAAKYGAQVEPWEWPMGNMDKFPSKKAYIEWFKEHAFWSRYDDEMVPTGWQRTVERAIADRIKEDDADWNKKWNERENYRAELLANAPYDPAADALNADYRNKKDPWRTKTAEETRRESVCR